MSDALAQARSLEASGDLDGAARAFVAAGAHQEAARIYTMAARPLDAAIALLAGIDMISADLDPAARGRAQLAASLLREGGREDYAKLVGGALGGGAAFPSAVLKSVLTASPAAEARVTGRPIVAEAKRSGGFVVRAPALASTPPRSIAPAPSPSSTPLASPSASAPAATPAQGVPRPSTSPVTPLAPRPAGTTPTTPTAKAPATPVAPRPAPAEGDRYRAEAGWHAADGAQIEETIQQFLATGRKGAAARVAWEAGQFERALPWFVELGLKYQAGSCLRSLGRPAEALSTLLEVPTDNQRYRRACFDVVALARETSRLDFEIDRFLTPFVGEGPKTADECATFLELAEVYAASGFDVGATRCAEGVLRVVPDDARAKALMARAHTHRSRAGHERAPRPVVADGDLTALPSLEEFVALARKHAPAKPGARK